MKSNHMRTRQKIVITRRIPAIAELMLRRKGWKVIVSPYDKVLAKRELRHFAKGASAILSLLTDKIDGGVMDAAGRQLRIIANYAVGFDNIDLAAARRRNIYVTNTPGVLTHAVAEHTIALLLAAVKRIVEADAFTRKGKYKGWEPDLFIGQELRGKTIGVVGLGRIGSDVAQMAYHGHAMQVVYTNPKRERELEKKLHARYLSLPKLLRIADVVTIHVPLTKETRHLIGRREFSLMKRSAVLINTSRGPVIDERALVNALRTRKIWAAGLDVFEHEPKLSPGLAKLPNVILTPHIASASIEARVAMAEVAARNITAVLSGRGPLNPVQ
jgi:lactate dehydrogenase-like 2-hydroxyacid dehydrogenase